MTEQARPPRPGSVQHAYLRTFYEWVLQPDQMVPAWHDPDGEAELRGTVPAKWLLDQLAPNALAVPLRPDVRDALNLPEEATVAEAVRKVRAYWDAVLRGGPGPDENDLG